MAMQEDGKVQVTPPDAKWNNVNEYCDTLDKLRKASYEHYLRRQTYEWKMCITIWTPLVAMIGIILTKSDVHIGFVPLTIASFFILAIHIVWQVNLKKSNDLDLERARKYEKSITDFVGVEIKQKREGWLIFQGWSHYIYVFITGGLIATSFYFNFSQREQLIPLPNDIQAWLEAKRHVSIAETDSPNAVQTIFALFYAITWGMLANVWPRWHAFDVTLKVKEGSIALKRWWISFCFLNLAPILFFIVIFMSLRSWRLSGPAWWDGIQLLVVIVQSFTSVGFYWIWISIVQRYRAIFYPMPLSSAYIHLREESDLDPCLTMTNFLWGLGYVLVPASLLGLVTWIK